VLRVSQQADPELETEVSSDTATIAPIDSRTDIAFVDTGRKKVDTETNVEMSSTGEIVRPPIGRFEQFQERVRGFWTKQREARNISHLKEIWKSDYTIVAFIPMVACYYLMKYTGSPFAGVLFFLLAVSTIDAILSIFVIRLSFHANKHRFYQTDDYERDWLRYRVLLMITKGVVFFMIGLKCGWTAILGAQILWFFTTAERLRYVILRWSMEDYFPHLQKWSIFLVLKRFGVEPHRKQFNTVAIVGAVLGLLVTLIF
jgi:hypothetical protein